jgi:broad specificity phosphatase PhoE
VTTLMIRHATTSVQEIFGQRSGAMLSDEGKMQAGRLAQRLRDVPVAAIYSSPLMRAVQTARIIGAGRDLTVNCDAALGEIDSGEWDGRTFRELAADENWQRFNTFRSWTRCPGGEMMIDVQARIVSLLERLRHEYEDKTVAIVSHADVIRAVICFALGIPLDLSLRLRIDVASISTLEIWDDGVAVVSVNVTEKNPVNAPSGG